MLEHIDEDEAALAAINRALRPGGGLIVTVPQHRWLWSETDRFSGHERRYTRRELRAKLAAAGFEPRLVTSFVSVLLPVMMASRAVSAEVPLQLATLQAAARSIVTCSTCPPPIGGSRPPSLLAIRSMLTACGRRGDCHITWATQNGTRGWAKEVSKPRWRVSRRGAAGATCVLWV